MEIDPIINHKTFLYSSATLMRFYNSYNSKDEIQVFRNLRPPVPEALTLFNII